MLTSRVLLENENYTISYFYYVMLFVLILGRRGARHTLHTKSIKFVRYSYFSIVLSVAISSSKEHYDTSPSEHSFSERCLIAADNPSFLPAGG